MLVQTWLFQLASKVRSSTPTFPENHLIKRFAPVWFWRVGLLAIVERIAEGDRDSKVKVRRNTQDRFGLLRFPHRGDAGADTQFPGGQLHIRRGLPQIEALGGGSNEGNSKRSSGQMSRVRAALS